MKSLSPYVLNKKVYFDHRWKHNTGIGRFSSELSASFPFEQIPLKGQPLSLFDTLKLTWIQITKIEANSVIFSPGFNAPLFILRSYIFCIMDLNHLDIVENSSFFKRVYYEFIIKRAVRNCEYVLTISDHFKYRISKWAGVPPEKIINVGCGVGSSFKPKEKNRRKVEDYFLCVSNRKSHKNEERIIEAFFKAKLPDHVQLIFTGYCSQYLFDQIANLKLEGKVRFAGSLDEDELIALYQEAIGLVFPSLYEGFGLPILEAMACGIPVLTSRMTAIPEVAADAALYVDPYNSGDIATGLVTLYSNTNIRDKLIEKGLERVKLFSWEATLNKVSAVLGKVGGGDED